MSLIIIFIWLLKPLITPQSENADGTIIALVAFIVARTLRGLRKWAVHSLNQKRSSMGSGGLRKGGAPVQIKCGGPFLYTLLKHVLSALAIKRNNAFHK